MSDLSPLVRTLTSSAVAVSDITTPRAHEVHCRVAPGAIREMAALAWTTLGAELILIAADDRRTYTGAFGVHYLFAHRAGRWLLQASVSVEGRDPEIPSLAPDFYRASRFEREIRDLFGIAFVGHPDDRPLVRHGFWPDDFYPLRKDARAGEFSDDGQPFPFTEVGGEGVYEIPVGPVHAGVIEPGHFRFSVMGETIIDMTSRLYFTHKGTEKLFEGRDPAAAVDLAERVSGDTTVGHALAYCQAVESACGADVPRRAQLLRVILLELERLYNHVGDFGAIANDTGFAIAHAHCYRVREQLLRVNKQFTGSRLMRGVLCPGGLTREMAAPATLALEVRAAIADFHEIVEISLANTLVRDRLEGTGVLEHGLANDYGVLGYVGRASGIDLDARRDHPSAAYGGLDLKVPVLNAGDVAARTLVRVAEVRQSVRLIEQACERLQPGEVRVALTRGEAFVPSVGVVEGWRGRIVHWVMVDGDGLLHRVKIVDPSFLNWPALAHALMGNIVPDFPLCNKSFNQSYSGNDL